MSDAKYLGLTANQLARIASDLDAENARLLEELADVPKCETCEAMLDCDECLRADVSHKERRRLAADNARLFAMLKHESEQTEELRELVRDMYEMAYPEYPSAFAAAFADRMSELGMEVEG